MKFLALLPVLSLLSGAAALPAPGHGNGHGNGHGDNGHHGNTNGNGCNGKGNPYCQSSNRPTIVASPFNPRVPFPTPAPRTRECVVPASASGGDDSQAILDAMHSCNNGGRVVFSKDTTYTIGTAMDWTFLKSIDLDIQGTLKFTDDTDYWQANSFKFVYQNATTFFKLGGDDVFVYGGCRNTDGWDTYRSTDVTIQNSHVNNGDDCVSFKPNSTNILVQSLWCNGSHGISVGSLGQYPGTYDIVENIYVTNISMSNASDGARIKVWPGNAAAMSLDLQGGGGSGRVQNITYENMILDNVDYAIEITQCYGQKNATLCTMFPSELTISNVVFRDFTGHTSAKYDPQTSYFQCSSPDVCYDIHATNINVTSPNGGTDGYCFNMDNDALDVTCTDTNNPGGESSGFYGEVETSYCSRDARSSDCDGGNEELTADAAWSRRGRHISPHVQTPGTR